MSSVLTKTLRIKVLKFVKHNLIIQNTYLFRKLELFNLRNFYTITYKEKNMQGKNLKLYFESHAVVKVAMVLVIMSICIPTDVCSNTISPLSFVGRTSGRINSHLMDKIMNLATKGKNFHPT